MKKNFVTILRCGLDKRWLSGPMITGLSSVLGIIVASIVVLFWDACVWTLLRAGIVVFGAVLVVISIDRYHWMASTVARKAPLARRAARGEGGSHLIRSANILLFSIRKSLADADGTAESLPIIGAVITTKMDRNRSVI